MDGVFSCIPDLGKRYRMFRAKLFLASLSLVFCIGITIPAAQVSPTNLLTQSEQSDLWGASGSCTWGGGSSTSCCGDNTAALAPDAGSNAAKSTSCTTQGEFCPTSFMTKDASGCGN